MNYTINEIPDTAEEANNTDYAIMWQNKTKKISISNLFKKLVKKSEVTNTISAINENPVSSKAVASLLTISASTTTITDAPPLQNGITLRIFFTSEITGSDNTTVLQISYNGTTYNVKVPKDGALQNYVAFEVSSGVFKYLQAYTTLELLFDGTQFVVIGNPVVISNADYTIYPDGVKTYNSNVIDSLRPKIIYEEKTTTFEVPIGNVELVILDWRGYASYYWIGLILSFQSGINIYSISTNTTNIPISKSGHTVTVSYEGQTPMVTRYKMNNVTFY